MNFQQLRSVREAVRCGFNLTEVAAALHTSQPGVSRQVREWFLTKEKANTNVIFTIEGFSFSGSGQSGDLRVRRGFASGCGVICCGRCVVRGCSGIVGGGYFEMPEVSAETWAHGWHHTGDMGRIDAEGPGPAHPPFSSRLPDGMFNGAGLAYFMTQWGFTPRETVAIVGASGSGKSTLLGLLAGHRRYAHITALRGDAVAAGAALFRVESGEDASALAEADARVAHPHQHVAGKTVDAALLVVVAAHGDGAVAHERAHGVEHPAGVGAVADEVAQQRVAVGALAGHIQEQEQVVVERQAQVL